MHADGNVRIDFHHRVHHVLQHDVVGVLAGAARGLDDHGRVGGVGGGHDGERLLHIVDVERGHAIALFGGVVEKLSKGDARHGLCSIIKRRACQPPLAFALTILGQAPSASTPGKLLPSIHSRKAPPAVEI